MALCMGMAKDLSFNAARGFVGGAARNGRRQARPWPQVSMPHAALWVVQQEVFLMGAALEFCFNAARGFVGGAASMFCVFLVFLVGFNAARGFVGGAAEKNLLHKMEDFCFNAARGFVGGAANIQPQEIGWSLVSMPHAALWVVQQERSLIMMIKHVVSMPHAALWVVQRTPDQQP